jgi:decaprenylphospho-beta-D-ribofuranose 2-oxidase
MLMSGWGRYPVVESTEYRPDNACLAEELIRANPGLAFIPRGLGRSYGDSALAEAVLSTERLDRFLRFDVTSGVLTCAAGVTISDVLEVFVPRGWFLPVTPGTRFVTIGGAVASDIHGKNHHLEGSFSDHVELLKVATVSEGVIACSRTHNSALFHATCGGMGLTGLILEVTFRLKPISSARMHETVIKADNLDQAVELFEEHSGVAYSVAWIDCLSRGPALGRSLVSLGEHAEAGTLDVAATVNLAVPIDMPGILMNRFLVRGFNALYYHRIRARRVQRNTRFDQFFYPLDSIRQWNRLYGRRGFVQYQFVIPKAAGVVGLGAILKRIAESRRGSFLAVLKAFGPANDNPLSFPMEGYTLALDFKRDRGLFPFLDTLDRMVLDCGGRIYLTKDSRMSEATFKQGYPQWQAFMETRCAYDANKVFNSLQSQRLGL